VEASVFVGTSLDGFIARADGTFDFLPSGGGEPHGYVEFMATVDALVIGRKTYETVLALGAWPYGAKPTFVLSTRPLAPAPVGAVVERMSGSPVEICSQLASRGIQSWHSACICGWWDYDSAVSPSPAHPATYYHARACAHWHRDSALWHHTARHHSKAHRNAPVRQRSCQKRV
jgi:hypothetical protein